MAMHVDLAPGVPPSDRMMPANESERLAIAQQGFTSLIIAAPRVDYIALMTTLLPLLRTSASVALFSPCLQPLVECYTAFKASGEFIAIQVAESWWREQQVLPSRTHPTMNTPGTGGYVLTATRVALPAKQQAKRAADAQEGSKRPPKRARH